MAFHFESDDFNRIVRILSSRPEFVNPLARTPFVIAMLQPSPRAADLLARLPITGVGAQTDAVSVVHYLLSFGQDVRGREAVTLVIRTLLDSIGEGEDRAFLFDLFERYPLESPGAGQPMAILFLTANPIKEAWLRLEAEYRDVDAALNSSRYRERFHLEIQPALRVRDIQEALMRYQPAIVHFSGHGAEQGLVFEDDAKTMALVPPTALAELFGLLQPKVRVVVLNACYSAAQAEELVRHVECVVGATAPIGDKAAAAFSTAFYRALGYGMSVQTAFDLGVNQIKLQGLKGADVLVLLPHAGIDLKQLKLV